jgi:hypothetical protein
MSKAEEYIIIAKEGRKKEICLLVYHIIAMTGKW